MASDGPELLPADVKPTNYALRLTPNFDDVTFDGSVSISITVSKTCPPRPRHPTRDVHCPLATACSRALPRAAPLASPFSVLLFLSSREASNQHHPPVDLHAFATSCPLAHDIDPAARRASTSCPCRTVVLVPHRIRYG